MPSKKEVLEELDEDLRNIKSDLDAAKEWSRQVMRVADALEHQTISQVMAQASLMGFVPTVAPSPKHLAACPACAVVKGLKPAEQKRVEAPIDAMNGIPILGQKK